MPLPIHIHIRCDTLALTSLNGHISTDISTDRSVEQKSETEDGDISLGQEGGLGRRSGSGVAALTSYKLARLGLINGSFLRPKSSMFLTFSLVENEVKPANLDRHVAPPNLSPCCFFWTLLPVRLVELPRLQNFEGDRWTLR